MRPPPPAEAEESETITSQEQTANKFDLREPTVVCQGHTKNLDHSFFASGAFLSTYRNLSFLLPLNHFLFTCLAFDLVSGLYDGDSLSPTFVDWH